MSGLSVLDSCHQGVRVDRVAFHDARKRRRGVSIEDLEESLELRFDPRLAWLISKRTYGGPTSPTLTCYPF